MVSAVTITAVRLNNFHRTNVLLCRKAVLLVAEHGRCRDMPCHPSHTMTDRSLVIELVTTSLLLLNFPHWSGESKGLFWARHNVRRHVCTLVWAIPGRANWLSCSMCNVKSFELFLQPWRWWSVSCVSCKPEKNGREERTENSNGIDVRFSGKLLRFGAASMMHSPRSVLAPDIRAVSVAHAIDLLVLWLTPFRARKHVPF